MFSNMVEQTRSENILQRRDIISDPLETDGGLECADVVTVGDLQPGG